MPHFIHHILWFSGHSNCFPPNYEGNWLPFLALHNMTTKGPELWELIRKLRRVYSLTQPVHVKVIQFFNFVIFPATNTLHPPSLEKNTHTTKQHVLFMLDQSLQKHTLMFIHEQAASVPQMNLFAIAPRTICLATIWLYCELKAAEVDLCSLKQFTTKMLLEYEVRLYDAYCLHVIIVSYFPWYYYL